MRKAGVSIMDVDGRTALGAGSSVLRDMLTAWRARPQDPVNLGEVFYLDNPAIGELA